MTAAAIHTEHLSHAFTLSRDTEPVVLEDINISLPPGSRTILVQPKHAFPSLSVVLSN